MKNEAGGDMTIGQNSIGGVSLNLYAHNLAP
jgi:hypothetical protein